VLLHRDLPLRRKEQEAKIYLAILRDTVEWWQTNQGHDLLAAAP
jgi:hypothetical protein